MSPFQKKQPSHRELGLFSLGPKFGDQILTMGGGHRRRGGRHGNTNDWGVKKKTGSKDSLEQLSNENIVAQLK